MAPTLGGYLRPGEEDWREVFERLCERFQNFSPERIANVLRENNGHAGQAASVLRDLSGTGMRPVDPDDAEHVRTLLSSPVMFSHACKEHFRKFDINGDGCLQWTEIVALVNSMYENFGLQPPREGGLRAFFEATDVNHDGVLSEKEFKRFFECFLRYAFFDVVNHQQQEQEARAQEQRERGGEPRGSPPRADRESRSRRGAGEEQQPPPQQQQPSPQLQTPQRADRAERHERRHGSKASGGSGGSRPPELEVEAGVLAGAYRCLAPHGVAYRKMPDAHSRLDIVVPKGEVVQALEHWIRTPQGWLPVAVESGELLFEPSEPSSKAPRVPSVAGAPGHDAADRRVSPSARVREGVSKRATRSGAEQRGADGGEGRRREKDRTTAPSPMAREAVPMARETAAGGGGGGGGGGGLRPGEEEWRERFERLQERFPTASPDDVAMALREQGGHAGQAATRLRELTKCG